MNRIKPYTPKNKIRIVTAASLFDGHDAAINIMRRIIQSTGVEVIHLGHDRSVEEVVNTAIHEDANAIAITSYQGGHNEYFKYMYDLLQEKGAPQIKIFGGGGGVILPEEIKNLQKYGITKIYSPDDGRKMGLQGMINEMVEKCDISCPSLTLPEGKGTSSLKNLLEKNDVNTIARLISIAENRPEEYSRIAESFSPSGKTGKGACPVLGITGTGGAGKSSLVDELVLRFLYDFPDKNIAIVSVDPSKRKTGGALLGDRIRMNSINNERVYMRSLATRQSNLALSKYVSDALNILKAAQYDIIILETSGIGQSDTEILDHSDVSLYVMTPEYGAATQLEKIDMIDFADVIALNKFDKKGSLDALRDVKKQYQRNHNLWEDNFESMPVYGTIASQFNDPGTNNLYRVIIKKIDKKTNTNLKSSFEISDAMSEKQFIIPPNRTRYLSEITENNHAYDKWCKEQSNIAQKLYGIYQTIETLVGDKIIIHDNGIKNINFPSEKSELIHQLLNEFNKLKKDLNSHNWDIILNFDDKKQHYKNDIFTFKVRDKEINILNHYHKLIFLKLFYQNIKHGVIYCSGLYKKMFQENFLLLQGYTPLKEQEKILQECLQEKVVQKEPIKDFIMLVLMLQLKDYQLLLTV